MTKEAWFALEGDYYTPEPNTGCWLWLRATDHGYGRMMRPGHSSRRAHRIAYEALIGPIPEGLTLDHLCRVRSCVNPAHLEPVTMRENLMRGANHVATQPGRTACPRGHAYTEANTYKDKRGRRVCRTCKRIWEAARRRESASKKEDA